MTQDDRTMPVKLTWKDVTDEIKMHGGICRSTIGGEHVVKIAGGTYYTDSPIDALGTAKAMYEFLGYNWETGEKTK